MTDIRLIQSTVEIRSAPVRGLLLATALAVILIFVLPIILLKAARPAPQQIPLRAPSASIITDEVTRQSKRMPKPQSPPLELMQYP